MRESVQLFFSKVINSGRGGRKEDSKEHGAVREDDSISEKWHIGRARERRGGGGGG